MDATLQDDKLRDIKRIYLDFLDDASDQDVYSKKVRQMMESNSCRLIVNINDLRRKFPERAKNLLNSSGDEIVGFQRALKDFVSSVDPAFGKQTEEFFVGFEGSFGSKHVTPRTLSSRHLNSLICVEGIVTKCSLVRPKVVRSVHYCPTTKKTIERLYQDMTSIDAFPSSSIYPTKDENGNPLETEYGLSVYKDHQTISIQEMPEKAPAGQLPRSVDIILDNDLVDSCKPGDRVLVIGVYRCLPNKQSGYTSGNFRTILLANNVKVQSKESVPTYSYDDYAKIKKFSKQKKDVFDELAHSLAPSIHGHEYTKKAILCLLLGGVEKNLENGTRLRGDINILLIGDPSVAKSQLLRFVLCTAPRAIPTTGRGSTGVGLTAAVTHDSETGERSLEAGAMVLGDRGVVCIDEFDKMSDADRTAIHEVMEQGRVTIAKAGIHATLKARCSVLAAANPVYGRYDQYKTPMENIGLQDSLLSRFDLLFIILDTMDPDQDRAISEHVLRMHRFRSPHEQDGEVLPFHTSSTILSTLDDDANENDEEDGVSIYERHDHLLHGDSNRKIVSAAFIRKYIHFAKSITPTLTKSACDLIADEYAQLRAQELFDKETQTARTQPVTPRTLETLIRLSTAHAKCRLSKTVTAQDANAAIEMIQFAYFKKVMKRQRKRRESDSDVENDDENATTNIKKQARKKKKASDDVAPDDVKRYRPDPDDPFDFDDDPVHRQPKSAATKVNPKILDAVRKSVHKAFTEENSQSLELDALITAIGIGFSSHSQLSRSEIIAYLEEMQSGNQIMLADDTVFLV